MPTTLSLDEHVAAVATAAEVLRDAARRAGLGAAVPTCPKWDVRQLVTHQGMVHRWAAAKLRADKSYRTTDSTAEAGAARDLFAWFSDGVDTLLTTIETTSDDADADVFLNDAPPPRRFWARRQAHETTVHSVDAVAAALGRRPVAKDLEIPRELAIDGIDELLCGFITRGKGRMRSGDPYKIGVTPSDADTGWTVAVSDGPVVTDVGRPGVAHATLSGTATQLYAGLWNRGDEIVCHGRADVLDTWKSQVRVRWGGG
jgi:uncharacterized protein (TIGR03083 family)